MPRCLLCSCHVLRSGQCDLGGREAKVASRFAWFADGPSVLRVYEGLPPSSRCYTGTVIATRGSASAGTGFFHSGTAWRRLVHSSIVIWWFFSPMLRRNRRVETVTTAFLLRHWGGAVQSRQSQRWTSRRVLLGAKQLRPAWYGALGCPWMAQGSQFGMEVCTGLAEGGSGPSARFTRLPSFGRDQPEGRDPHLDRSGRSSPERSPTCGGATA
ncbi:unnamed protein product [Durusdinium trenchii]|uniref:Uncharacterized protein n=1 Tax=Durusdinium trenchii TaxID=1381693 RepID=A0ABP0KFZ8_9DINO